MGTTKKQVRDNVFLELYQGAPSQDANLPELQVDYWIGIHLNALVANECNEKYARRELIPNVYIKKVACQVLTSEETDCGNRVYATLTDKILVVNHGGGIIRIEDEDGNEIKQADPRSLSLFKNMRFAKPSYDNILFSHEGTKIYLEGLKPGDVPFDEINVFYVPNQDVLTMSDSTELLVSDLTLPMLIDAVVERGKRELYGTQIDESNDGVDPKTPVYHTAISNPTK